MKACGYKYQQTRTPSESQSRTAQQHSVSILFLPNTAHFNSNSITMTSSSTPVALVAGTHIWEPTPENLVFQDELLKIIRKHGITRLDTARAYVCCPPLRCPESYVQNFLANAVPKSSWMAVPKSPLAWRV